MILVIDTSTQTSIVALARTDGALAAEQRWHSRHRHGEELLERIDQLLRDAQIGKAELTAVVVGTGPGSFTGLRIGLATAKTIAYSLDVPIVGIESTVAFAGAIGGDSVTVTLPAGASDRYVHRVGGRTSAPKLVADSKIAADDVAIDFEQAPKPAHERGEKALAGLAASLARLGAARLAGGESDDVALLVPAYVALPRGIAKAAAEMEWSPDLR
jgi:tRNA threonylcarbamoyl adenosine modification protein YeaZ